MSDSDSDDGDRLSDPLAFATAFATDHKDITTTQAIAVATVCLAYVSESLAACPYAAAHRISKMESAVTSLFASAIGQGIEVANGQTVTTLQNEDWIYAGRFIRRYPVLTIRQATVIVSVLMCLVSKRALHSPMSAGAVFAALADRFDAILQRFPGMLANTAVGAAYEEHNATKRLH